MLAYIILSVYACVCVCVQCDVGEAPGGGVNKQLAT